MATRALSASHQMQRIGSRIVTASATLAKVVHITSLCTPALRRPVRVHSLPLARISSARREPVWAMIKPRMNDQEFKIALWATSLGNTTRNLKRGQDSGKSLLKLESVCLI